MAYQRINWKNEPIEETPLSAENLNHMEGGIVQNETDIAGKMDANNPIGTGSLQVGTGNMKTDGNPSYALGFNAQAEGDNSFAFGSSTRAKKQGAYAIGIHAEAREYYSMALGEEVIAASIHQTVRGKYNEIDADGVYLDIVGGGDPSERKNVETLTPNGDKWVAGDYTNGNGETLHGAYQAFIDGLPVDSESGNPCVITDAFNTNAKSVKLTLNPIQDLHGYNKPWVGGNGKNKLFLTDETVTKSGVTITPIKDAAGNLIGYDIDGTATANVDHWFATGLGLEAGTNRYITTGLSIEKVGFQLVIAPSYTGVKTNTTLSLSINGVYINITSGTSFSHLKIQPMICLASESDKSFAPYENICPISGRTEANVARTGKNLFNPVNVINGYFNPSTPITTMDASRIAFIKCVPNTTYTISKQLGARFVVGYTKEIPNAGVSVYGAVENNTASSLSITVGSDAKYLVTFVYNSNYDTITAEQMLASVQIEVGSTATTYEPYNGETITRTYGQTVYGGSDDVMGDGATSTYEYVEYDGSNDENWNYGASIGLNQFYIQNTGIKYSTLNIACNRLKTIALQDRANNYNTIYTGTNVDSININMETITSVEAWRSWLSANPLQVAYEVATPTSIPLTSQDLPLLKGDNVITTNADSIDTEYAADIALYIAKKIAEGVDSTRSLSKGGSSESTEETKEEITEEK